MSTEQNITQNIKPINPSIDKLKQSFPHCFDKNGSFDFEKFKNELLSLTINIAKEGYSLDWLGKSYARILASDAATTLLKEDEDHNIKPENTNSQNLLIKGDNLEVLKHLSNAYYEKVKMIYIDPPYNTGSDGFVYNDDRKFTAKQLQDLAGISEEEAKRILEFTQSNSNSHSAWLTFMYPRLYIAKQLLKDDGVIFVSIDDNEVAQLRLLMDEVFGEENFVSDIIWSGGRKNDSKHVSISHEHILCYFKSKHIITTNSVLWRERKLGLEIIYKKANELVKEFNNDYVLASKHLKKWYKTLDESNPVLKQSHYNEIDENGVFYADNISWPGGGGPTYDVIHPITKKSVKVPSRGWLFSTQERMQELIDKGLVKFGIDESSVPTLKSYLKDREYQVPYSVIYKDGRASTKRLMNLFGAKVFENPKDESIISNLAKLHTNNSDIIVDFFAGSGTTAHSVMQLNSEDCGSRKYILVQLAELIDAKKNKIAYDFVKDELGITPPTVFDITKERIIRTAKQIGESNAIKTAEALKEIEKLQKEDTTEEKQTLIEKLHNKVLQWQQQDIGFKVYETTPIWEDYNFKAEKLVNAGRLFDDDKLTDNDIKALLTTWKTYDGSSLTEPVESVDLAGYNVYYTKKKLYIMHKGFTTNTLKALLERIDTDVDFNPTAIIAFGYYLESKSLREIAENIKTYNNKKNIDIDFITRY